MAAPVATRVTIVTGRHVPMASQVVARGHVIIHAQVLHSTPASSMLAVDAGVVW